MKLFTCSLILMLGLMLTGCAKRQERAQQSAYTEWTRAQSENDRAHREAKKQERQANRETERQKWIEIGRKRAEAVRRQSEWQRKQAKQNRVAAYLPEYGKLVREFTHTTGYTSKTYYNEEKGIYTTITLNPRNGKREKSTSKFFR